MSVNWEDIYNAYVNESQEDLAKHAKQYFYEIYEAFADLTNDRKGAFMFAVNLFTSYIAADKEITPAEFALFNYIFEIEDAKNYDNILGMINRFRELSSYDELNEMSDKCDISLKEKMIKFGLCVCAIDESITVSEQEMISRYAN